MWFLFLQIWFFLVLAFILGWISHWFISRPSKEDGGPNKENEANEQLIPED